MVLYLIIALDFSFQKVGGNLIDDGAINHTTKAIANLIEMMHLPTYKLVAYVYYCPISLIEQLAML